MMQKKPLIESECVGFAYAGTDAAAVSEVSLAVMPGECVLLCGRSGCGKTTFTRLLNGLSPMFFKGDLAGQCAVAGLMAGRARIEDYVPVVGNVFQNPVL